MPASPPLEYPAIAVAALLALAAAVGLRRRDNSVVDVFWGPSFLVAAIAAAAAAPTPGPRTWLALAMVAAWALRLAWHIGRRWRSHPGEDWRYAAWRRQWGASWWWRSILQVYLLQGVLALVASTAVFIAIGARDQQLDAWSIVGVVVWLAGMTVEVTADRQLASFVARKRSGRASGFCTEGLWGWSRHPNYLGEALLWWGVSISVLGVPGGLLGIVSAALVTTLVRFVSGVPILERAWRDRPGFETWAARTPVFLPRRPTHHPGD